MVKDGQALKPVLLLCLFVTVCHSVTDPNDLQVLNDFRRGLDNADRLKWPQNGDDDPCGPPSWPHVFCSGDRVSQIQVQNLGLKGILPPNFNALSRLTNVGLQGNRFSGELPTFRGLSELEFAYLDNNEFDSIPSDFFAGLTTVRVLALDRNPFNATAGWSLPADVAESVQLTNLSLVGCNLVGPIPEFLTALPFLTVLKLSYNRFTGEIPVGFGDSLVQILWLNDQDGDGIGGTLDVIASMTMLTQAWLHGNRFSGEIPERIGDLPSLKELNLNGNNLVGTIPQCLAAMKLRRLDLSNNLLVGPIPKFESGNVALANNYFCELCPPEVTALLDFLRGVNYPERLVRDWSGDDPCSGPWMGLSCNPDKEISIINLPRRSLNGTISASVATLHSLIEIRLSGNNISGEIPENLTRLEHLRLLDLSGNNLDHPLPRFPDSTKVVVDRNPFLLVNKTVTLTVDGITPSQSPPFTTAEKVNPNRTKQVKQVTVIVSAICSVSALALLMTSLSVHRRQKRRNKSVTKPDPEKAVKIAVSSGSVVSVEVLRKATAGFAAGNELGRGGFGTVYRGELEDGTSIAVKRMAGSGGKAMEEFEAEVAVLSRVRHRHVVSLLGYTVEGGERLLVYDYMPQGALSRHLFHWRSLGLEPLTWTSRLVIALDVARGIEYLHGLARETFIHRDLKSANILLDDDFRAKVADFGLVKLAPDGGNSIATKLAGTFGYLAPEYAVMGKITTKADVFSFGVVLMELVTGLTALDENRPEESRYLANWFWKLKSSEDKLMAALDPALNAGPESVARVAELAGHCTARDPARRPDMGHVVGALSQLVENWKPAAAELDGRTGIDYGQPLPQQLKAWQARDGDGGADLSDSKGSIPARPVGFADSLTSTDAR